MPDELADKREGVIDEGTIVSGRPSQNNIAATRKPDEYRHDNKSDRFNFKVAAELFLGFVIAAATVVNVCVAYRQWAAMIQNNGIASGQLEVMQNEKRPWIKVSVSTKDPLRFSEWSGDKGILIRLQFELKNAGDAPAVNLRVFSQIRPHPGNPKRSELDGPQNEACIQARTQADENAIGGIAIFAGDSTALEPVVGASGIYKTNDPILFSVYGCVDYTYAGTRHRQTGYRMMLGRVITNQIHGLPFIEGIPEPYPEPIPPDLLAAGYPAKPPNIGLMQPSDFYFRPDDGGNYAN